MPPTIIQKEKRKAAERHELEKELLEVTIENAMEGDSDEKELQRSFW